MHGHPEPPCRVRTNNDSSFVCMHVAVLSCRADSVTSLGSFTGLWGKHAVNSGRPPAPLSGGLASIECNTSGVFYKGFPRAVWLQVLSRFSNIACMS